MKNSLLIVDDEYCICEGLKTKILNLNIPDIGEIRTCYSGKDALELCRTYKPQIVLTDIKMEDIDGIHLIHELKLLLYPVRFLVFSGYDDYKYVRNAFQEGAVDYLLKPVLSEQLDSILRTQCEALRKSNLIPTSRSAAIEFFQRFLNILETSENQFEYEESLEIIQKYLSCKNYTFALAAGVGLTSTQIHALINSLYDSYDTFNEYKLLCGKLSNSKIGILINFDHVQISSYSIGEHLLTYAKTQLNIDLAVGFSSICQEPDFKHLYYEAENNLAERLVFGYGKIYMHRNLTTNEMLLNSAKNISEILLDNPEFIGRSQYWTNLSHLFKKMNIGTLQSFYSYLTGKLYSAFSDHQATDASLCTIPSFYTFDTLNHFHETVLQLFRYHAAAKTVKVDSQLDIVKKYIDDHFTENFTLLDVAEHFFISYSHLSNVFHKTFGIPFQTYVISKRMNYAKELLQNPNLSIQEIAADVGYNNVFNFSRSFKNYFGVSPSHYRSSIK